MEKEKDIYIALDLETSGTDPEEDKIIEIGLAKIKNDQIIDTFQTLINPQKKVAENVLAITGISEEDLKKAPIFEQIKEKIIKFIGNYPIIGHNIQFDLNFLNKEGLEIKNPFYDTWHLATIILPHLPSHSLSYLTSKLNLEHLEAHRALSDAVASYYLFAHLKNEIKKLSPSILREIYQTLDKSGSYYKNIFLPEKEKKVFKNEVGEKIKSSPKNEFQKYIEIFGIQEDEISVLKSITQSILENKKIFIEGYCDFKTIFLYLLFWSFQKNEKIILAVPNIKEAKQQIKDINKIFFLPPSFSILEDFKNYICPLRFEEFSRQIKKNPQDELKLRFWIKAVLLIEKLESEVHEDIKAAVKDDLSLIKEELDLFSYINVPFENCWQICPHDCFYKKTIEQAQASQLLIVDQKLLTQASLNSLFENFPNLVVFEAENLEEEVQKSQSITILPQDLDLILEIAQKYKIGNQIISQLEKIVDIFWGLLGIVVKKEGERKERNKNFVIFEKSLLLSGDFKNFQKSTLHLLNLLNEITADLKEKIKDEKNFTKKIDLLFALKKSEGIIQNLKEGILDLNNENWVFWGEIFGKEQLLKIAKKPLYIKNLILNAYKNKKSVVLLSTSFSLDKKLDFVKESIGAFDFEEKIILPSLKTNTKEFSLVIVDNFPQPDDLAYKNSLEQLIENIAASFKKPIFVFSNRQIQNELFTTKAPFFRKSGIDLWVQEGSRLLEKNLEDFSKASKGVLFAMPQNIAKFLKRKPNSQLMIFEKFPFSPPKPIDEAKEGILKEKFIDYHLNKAILDFKKIIELFRAQTERGVVVILNRKMIEKDYGINFIQSLYGASMFLVKKENLFLFLRKKLKEE